METNFWNSSKYWAKKHGEEKLKMKPVKQSQASSRFLKCSNPCEQNLSLVAALTFNNSFGKF